MSISNLFSKQAESQFDNRKPENKILLSKLHKQVIAGLKDIPQNFSEESEHITRKIRELVDEINEKDSYFLSKTDRHRLSEEIINDSLGYGPITPLLHDPEITEVMVNDPANVYVERKGKIELSGVEFRDKDHIMNIIEKIVAPIGRRIDEGSPMADARLPDGSRVNAIIPPLALNGPVLTIRKFSSDPITDEKLIDLGTVSRDMVNFLKACVRSRLNIVVSGGTGSGKTTTLNVLSAFIPTDERIITIEDAAELQLKQEHVITLESRPPNIEGKGNISIRDLVRNTLRMRPDRIIVGEIRGGEALDMLQAMNTGHDGSLTTGHANSPRDMLSRLETMVLMAGMDLPIRAIREQISSAIDLIIHQSRMRDGSRKITHITEVQGMEGDVVVLQDLYRYKVTSFAEGKLKGGFVFTEICPKFIDKLELSGYRMKLGRFHNEWGD